MLCHREFQNEAVNFEIQKKARFQQLMDGAKQKNHTPSYLFVYISSSVVWSLSVASAAVVMCGFIVDGFG